MIILCWDSTHCQSSIELEKRMTDLGASRLESRKINVLIEKPKVKGDKNVLTPEKLNVANGGRDEVEAMR